MDFLYDVLISFVGTKDVLVEVCVTSLSPLPCGATKARPCVRIFLDWVEKHIKIGLGVSLGASIATYTDVGNSGCWEQMILIKYQLSEH